MSENRFESVWDAPREAPSMKARGDLMRRPCSINAIGAIALAGVAVFGVLVILWEIVKQPLALIYGLVGLGVGYAMVRAIWLAVGA